MGAAGEPFASLSVRADWLEQRAESCGQKLALAPLVPVAWSYALGAALHRAAYASGLIAPRRFLFLIMWRCMADLMVRRPQKVRGTP